MTGDLPSLGPAEQAFLLACARLESDATEVARLVDQELDWDAVLSHARLHSVAPLVHHHLAVLGDSTQPPAEVRTRLLELVHRTAFQNHHFAIAHREIVQALRDDGLDAIAPKGLPLVELVYRSHALRPLLDLVYLVRPDELDAARRIMPELGYREYPLPRLARFYRWTCPQHVFHASREIGTTVMLFTDPVNWPRAHRLDVQGVWSRAETTDVAGARTLVFSPEDLIVYLCLQIDNSGFFNRVAVDRVPAEELLFAPWANNRLIRFTDLYEAARHYSVRIDWSAVVERVHRAGLAGVVSSGVRLTEQLLGPVAGSAAPRGSRSTGRDRLRRAVLTGLRAERDGGAANPLQRAAARRVLAIPAARRIELMRLADVVELVFPGRDGRAMPYPHPSVPVRVRHAAVTVGRCLRSVLSADTSP